MNSRHGNLQKHLNPNPIQQRLLARFHRRIAKLVETTQAKTILDAGCGEGFVIQSLRKTSSLPQNGVIGIDLSAEALAWQQTQEKSPVPLNLADIHRLPFPNNSFDLVYALEVLEHLPDSSTGLRELARVSQNYVLVSVPHEPFFRGVNFLRGKHLRAFGNDPEHLHNYSGRAFQQLVSRQITVLQHIYSFPWQIILGQIKQ